MTCWHINLSRNFPSICKQNLETRNFVSCDGKEEQRLQVSIEIKCEVTTTSHCQIIGRAKCKIVVSTCNSKCKILDIQFYKYDAPNNKPITISNCLKSNINYGYINTMVKDVSIPDLGIYDKHLDKDNNRLTGTQGVT